MQLGYILKLVDDEGKSNTLLYGSIRPRMVTRRVHGPERFETTNGFDIASTVCLDLNDISGRNIPIKFYMDSRSLFHCLMNISST